MYNRAKLHGNGVLSHFYIGAKKKSSQTPARRNLHRLPQMSGPTSTTSAIRIASVVRNGRTPSNSSTSAIRVAYPPTNGVQPPALYKAASPAAFFRTQQQATTASPISSRGSPIPKPSPYSNGAQGREEARRQEACGGGAGGGEGHGGEEAQGREAAPRGQVRRQGGWREEGEEEGQEVGGDVQDLHLQGAEAGAPGHWHLVQGHVHHELLHQRHLREAGGGGGQAGAVQQEAYHYVPRDPDLRPPRPPRRARQARRLRGHQSRHQVH
jgi:hypothetical protein